MNQSFARSLALTLRHEGGYADHPQDPGGATMKGVTQRVYDAYRAGRGKTLRGVSKIADDELHYIYRAQYWDLVQGDRLPAGVDAAVFDYAVHSGATRASRALQAVLGVRVDGNIGLATINAAQEMDGVQLVEALCDERLAFLKRLKTWPVFGKGWSRRVAEVREACTTMVEPDAEMVAMDFEILRGDATDEEMGSAPADPRQIGVMSTKTGQGTAIGSVGLLGTMASEAADKFEPLARFSPIMMVMFGGLLVAGFGLTAYGVVRAIREERAA